MGTEGRNVAVEEVRHDVMQVADTLKVDHQLGENPDKSAVKKAIDATIARLKELKKSL